MNIKKCGVCQLVTQILRNPLKEYLGEPAVAINELITQCTGVTISLGSGICTTCCEKFNNFYRATQAVELIKGEILELLRGATDNTSLKSKNAESRKNSERDAEKIKFENISLMVENGAVEKIDDALCMDEEECAYMEADETDEYCIFEDPAEINPTRDTTTNTAHAIPSDNSAIIRNDDEQVFGGPETKQESDINVENLNLRRGTKASAKLSCFDCGLTFSDKRKHRHHIISKHSPDYVCEHCGKILQTQSSLYNHLKGHDPMKNFVCSVCDQHFMTRYSLRLHVVEHSEGRPFQCDICRKRYVHKTALDRHKLSHNKDTRREECKECGLKFRSNSHLQRHMLTHTGAKPHSCPICGKRFALAYNMKVHLQEHEQPGSMRRSRLKCKKCTHTFINKQNYKEHCERGGCNADSNRK